MAKDPTKTVAPTQAQSTSAQIDGEQWNTERTGFPPYWKPEVDKTFTARVTEYHFVPEEEEDSSNFSRYYLATTADLTCQRGSPDDESAESVIVPKGELFSLGDYAAIDLTPYIGFIVKVTVKSKRTLTKTKRDMWDFHLQTREVDRAAIEAQKSRQALAARNGAGQLPDAAAV